MKCYRNSVFETNSSSSHSFTVCVDERVCNEDLNIPKKVIIGELDKRVNIFKPYFRTIIVNDFLSKLAFLFAFSFAYVSNNTYLVTSHLESCEGLTSFEIFEMSSVYNWLCEVIIKRFNCELKVYPFDYPYCLEDLCDCALYDLGLPILNESAFKDRVYEILSNTHIVLKYIEEYDD